LRVLCTTAKAGRPTVTEADYKKAAKDSGITGQIIVGTDLTAFACQGSEAIPVGCSNVQRQRRRPGQGNQSACGTAATSARG